jgi:hypothetical protein
MPLHALRVGLLAIWRRERAVLARFFPQRKTISDKPYSERRDADAEVGLLRRRVFQPLARLARRVFERLFNRLVPIVFFGVPVRSLSIATRVCACCDLS